MPEAVGGEVEESRLPRMRDMKLNDPVSVTLPAHIWVGFQSVYMSAEGNGDFFSEAICNASIDQIIDPLYVQERDAATEKRTHEGLRHLADALNDRLPDIPPDLGEIGEIDT